MKNRLIIRLVGLLLVPCLVIDPASASQLRSEFRVPGFVFETLLTRNSKLETRNVFTDQAAVPFLTWFTRPSIFRRAQSRAESLRRWLPQIKEWGNLTITILPIPLHAGEFGAGKKWDGKIRISWPNKMSRPGVFMMEDHEMDAEGGAESRKSKSDAVERSIQKFHEMLQPRLELEFNEGYGFTRFTLDIKGALERIQLNFANDERFLKILELISDLGVRILAAPENPVLSVAYIMDAWLAASLDHNEPRIETEEAASSFALTLGTDKRLWPRQVYIDTLNPEDAEPISRWADYADSSQVSLDLVRHMGEPSHPFKGFKLVSVDSEGKLSIEGYVIYLPSIFAHQLTYIEIAPENRTRLKLKGVGTVLTSRVVLESVRNHSSGRVYSKPESAAGMRLGQRLGRPMFASSMRRSVIPHNPQEWAHVFSAITVKVARTLLNDQRQRAEEGARGNTEMIKVYDRTLGEEIPTLERVFHPEVVTTSIPEPENIPLKAGDRVRNTRTNEEGTVAQTKQEGEKYYLRLEGWGQNSWESARRYEVIWKAHATQVSEISDGLTVQPIEMERAIDGKAAAARGEVWTVNLHQNSAVLDWAKNYLARDLEKEFHVDNDPNIGATVHEYVQRDEHPGDIVLAVNAMQEHFVMNNAVLIHDNQWVMRPAGRADLHQAYLRRQARQAGTPVPEIEPPHGFFPIISLDPERPGVFEVEVGLDGIPKGHPPVREGFSGPILLRNGVSQVSQIHFGQMPQYAGNDVGWNVDKRQAFSAFGYDAQKRLVIVQIYGTGENPESADPNLEEGIQQLIEHGVKDAILGGTSADVQRFSPNLKPEFIWTHPRVGSLLERAFGTPRGRRINVVLKIRKLQESPTPDAAGPSRTFRFSRDIWDAVYANLQNLPIPGLADYVKMNGLAWTDGEGSIHWIHEGLGNMATEAIWTTVRETLNATLFAGQPKKRFKSNGHLQDFVESHEFLHSEYTREDVRIQHFRTFLENRVFGVPLTIDHPFIQGIRRAYGAAPFHEWTHKQDVVNWYIEEFLVLSHQEIDTFRDEDRVLDEIVRHGEFNRISPHVTMIKAGIRERAEEGYWVHEPEKPGVAPFEFVFWELLKKERFVKSASKEDVKAWLAGDLTLDILVSRGLFLSSAGIEENKRLFISLFVVARFGTLTSWLEALGVKDIENFLKDSAHSDLNATRLSIHAMVPQRQSEALLSLAQVIFENTKEPLPVLIKNEMGLPLIQARSINRAQLGMLTDAQRKKVMKYFRGKLALVELTKSLKRGDRPVENVFSDSLEQAKAEYEGLTNASKSDIPGAAGLTAWLFRTQNPKILGWIEGFAQSWLGLEAFQSHHAPLFFTVAVITLFLLHFLTGVVVNENEEPVRYDVGLSVKATFTALGGFAGWPLMAAGFLLSGPVGLALILTGVITGPVVHGWANRQKDFVQEALEVLRSA